MLYRDADAAAAAVSRLMSQPVVPTRLEFMDARSLELLRMQLARLEEKAAQLGAMVDYTRAKLAWMESGQQGPEPLLGNFEACPAQPSAQAA